MFGAIGVLAALQERHRTGKGQLVKSSLFESTIFLVGQHMAQYAVTGTPAAPMPARISAWAIYDVFETSDDEKVFVAVVSDTQWPKFCASFGLDDLAADETLAVNTGRVKARETLIPRVAEVFRGMPKGELMGRLEQCGLPYAPIAKPEDLFDDPHLNSAGGLVDVTVPGGASTKLPALPISLAGERLGARRDVPQPGADALDVLRDAGYGDDDIDRLIADGVVDAG